MTHQQLETLKHLIELVGAARVGVIRAACLCSSPRVISGGDQLLKCAQAALDGFLAQIVCD